MKISYINLFAKNNQKLIEFLRDKVGLEDLPDQDQTSNWYGFDTGKTKLAIEPEENKDHHDLGIDRSDHRVLIQFRADSLEELRSKSSELESRGVNLLTNSKKRSYGYVTNFVDPENNLFEILYAPQKYKIVAISGSIREKSYNRMAVNEMIRLSSDFVDVEFFDISTLPFYSEDLEVDPPKSVKNFAEKLQNSDGILIASPEYDGFFSGVLKNALEWSGRGILGKPIKNIPIATFGVTTGGFGTVKSEMNLRTLLTIMDAEVMRNPTLRISQVHDKFSDAGRLIDEELGEKMIGFMQSFVFWIGKFK